MTIEQNDKLSEFIAGGNISSTVKVNAAILNEYSLDGYPFNSECANENNAPRTFFLEIHPPLLRDAIGQLPAGEVTNPFAKNGNNQSEFCQHFRAKCSTCGAFHYDILLDVQMKRERYDRGRKTKHEVIIRKVAHSPEPPVPEIGKELRSILKEDDQNLYSRALKLRKAGYGIGAFAYLRRVIESMIRELSGDFESKHVGTLIEDVYKDLPDNLRNGDNPIKLLWEQFSSGLHQLTEDECLKKVNDGVQILTWVVKEIYNEKNEGQSAKEAIKRFRTGDEPAP